MRKFRGFNTGLLNKNYILLMFILLNITFCCISNVSINNRYENMLTQSMQQEQKVVEDFFRYPENIINLLSQNDDLAEYRQDDRFLRNDILSLFESVILSDYRISNIYFVAKDGNSISYIFTEEPGPELAQRTWFKKAMEGKTQFTWISHKSDFANVDVISCVRRVVDKYNNPVGVIGLDIEFHKLSTLVHKVKIGDNGYFMILDADNKIIATYHSQYKYLGKNIGKDSLPKNIKMKSDKSFISKINNTKYKCRVSQVEELPWKIVGVIPAYEIMYNIVILVVVFFSFSLVSLSIAFMMYSKNKTTQHINEELKNANEQLKKYASTVEENAVLRERNRLAKDVHDTLGQTLSILITLLQVSILACRSDPKEAEYNLNNALKITQDGLNEVRRSISGLIPKKLEENNLFDALESLVTDFGCSGLEVELSVNKFVQNIDTSYKEVIYRICQEALTNSIKHGKATKANIIIKFSDNFISLFIFDNGKGCKSINTKKGFGLHGMKQRIKKLNGELKFGSSDENGFSIHVELPLGETKLEV